MAEGGVVEEATALKVEEAVPAASEIPEGYHFAVAVSELDSLGRKTVVVDGRRVAVFLAKHHIYCLDYFCYHAGGPLGLGDIEDSHGILCVVCPWHKHTITLNSGESLYTAIDPFNNKLRKHSCTKGVKQRVHSCKIIEGNVYVKLSDLHNVLESDKYYSEEFAQLTEHVLRDPIIQSPHRKQMPIMHVPIRTKSIMQPDTDDEEEEGGGGEDKKAGGGGQGDK